MTTFLLIISIYIALNLAMLAFRFKRLDWCDILSVRGKSRTPYSTFPKIIYYRQHPEEKAQLHEPQGQTPPLRGAKRFIPSREKWGANINQNTIYFDTSLPFIPSIYDVIYVEDEYNPIVNQFIQEHYEELKQRFAAQQLTFNYLPKICQQPVPQEVIQYMFPFIQTKATFVNGNFTLEVLKQHISKGNIEGPALIHFIHTPVQGEEGYMFTYCPLVAESEISLNDQLKWYLDHESSTSVTLAAPSGSSSDENTADLYFVNSDDNLMACKSTKDLTEEIQVRIRELRRRGLQLHLIRELIDEKPTLSRLVIDKEYRIFLPDYNNVEIVMSPLPKSVYLLFLKHPEGILFKQLRDYYAELLDIYKQVSNRVIEENIEKSIRDITDPTKNSINEKCARIREAFLRQFDETYAKFYYITGYRGAPKKIILSRRLVDLQGL